MALLVSGTPPVTTDCITDENNPQLQGWLAAISFQDLVANTKKSSTLCADSPLTLTCLKESIIPALNKTFTSFNR